MSEPLTILTAWLLGFMGSLHCMGMCGGIVGALSLNTAKNHQTLNTHLAYHLGRILTYGLLGLLAGLLGLWLAESHDLTGLILRTLSGALLVLMGVYLLGLTQALSWLERAGGTVWKRIQPLSKRVLPVQRPSQAMALGLIWGFLPCGLVYSTLSWALVSASPLESAGLMIAFGLGNLPALLSFSLFAQQLNQFRQQLWVKRVSGLLIISFGLWTSAAPWL